MKTNLIRLTLLASLLVSGLPACTHGAAKPVATFTLQDWLKRSWQNELVFFPVKTGLIGKSGYALLGPDGNPVPYQWVPANQSPNGKPSIAFQANVAEFGKSTYQLVKGAPVKDTNLAVKKAGDGLEVINQLTGVRLNQGAKAISEGPIGAIRLRSGGFVGGGNLKLATAPTNQTVEVVASGPVFVDAVSSYRFADGGTWRLKFRVMRGEPVVLVDETFSLNADASYALNLSRGFSPENIFHRFGSGTPRGSCGKPATWKLTDSDGQPPFVLEPWLHWQQRERQGNWFALYNASSPDLLMIGALNGSVWVDPERRAKSLPQSPTQLTLGRDGDNLSLGFSLLHGQRKWMLAALDKAQSLPSFAEGQKYEDEFRVPLPQQYLIKHGDFPLDLVKEYVFEWKGDFENHPRLFLKKADLPAWRKTIGDPAELEKRIPNYLRDPNPLNQFTMEGPITAFLATSNTDLGKYLVSSAARCVQQSVDMYVKQDSLVTLCFAPHHQQIVADSMAMADSILASDLLSPELRARLLAQIAFLGYTVDRPDYWSPERGFAANPNMTTSVYGYKAVIACIIPSHPKAQDWVKDALRELKDQLDNWSDDNGGWLEAPHYAMVSYDQILGVLLMTYNAGFNNFLYDDPKVKIVINWFSKISTPPDTRLGGFRHLPPIGNTYMQEPTGEFGILAKLFKDKDPEFASQMQWMFRQQNSFALPGIGGGYPALAGYRSSLLDPTIPEKAPPWKSELFPKTGVILCNKYPSDRETMLHMIAGSNHAHYDKDSGSITLWGKGRILADDFGYYGYVTGDDHNMVVSAVAPDAAIMKVEEFIPSENLDYVRGVKLAWQRQIAFVKDADPLAPNYFVVCDTLKVPAPAVWRLWCTANKVTPNAAGALLEGKEDVDMDIFFALPQNVALTTEEITRKSGAGLYPDFSNRGAFASTQTGLIATLKLGTGFTVVLYPRLKTEKPPVITAIADGKGVKVQSGAGTDYVFLSAEPFKFQEGDVAFEGTVGAAQIRGEKAVLSLGAAGSIAAKGQTLQSEKPASKIVK